MSGPQRPTGATLAEERPHLHFTAHGNWINDPNGLVFHDGKYHLFFQHNPNGLHHAEMSWGHASSTDLSTWDEHPVALLPDDAGEIYSGSIVIDSDNSSGLGTVQHPPLVAIYTIHDARAAKQTQGLAFSTDAGMTWTKYAGNPVLDRDSADFRDPKVFWYEGDAGAYWVMIAVEAEDRQVVLYRSENLRDWTFLSSYGPQGAVGGVWECPDLFPVKVEGHPGDERWVMLISINPGGIAGGSGTQVVIGWFDGVTFTPDTRPPLPVREGDGFAPQSRAELEAVDWLDWGRDCYAGVTFSGLQGSDPLLIAWMSNWDYARDVPTAPWRGSMTLPRRLSLVAVDDVLRLRQTPQVAQGTTIAAFDELAVGQPFTVPAAVPDSARLDVQVRLQNARGFALRIRHDDAGRGGVVVRYDAEHQRIEVDRTGASGDFNAAFASVQSAPVPCEVGTVSVQIWLDVSSIEVFAAHGVRTITDLIFTESSSRGLTLEGIDGEVAFERLAISTLGRDERISPQIP